MGWKNSFVMFGDKSDYVITVWNLMDFEGFVGCDSRKCDRLGDSMDLADFHLLVLCVKNRRNHLMKRDCRIGQQHLIRFSTERDKEFTPKYIYKKVYFVNEVKVICS